MRLQTKILGAVCAIAAFLALAGCDTKTSDFHVSQGDHDRIAQAESEVLKANPQLGAEFTDLETKLRETKYSNGNTSGQIRECEEACDSFRDSKLRPEVEKADPSLKLIYARIASERSNLRSDGLSEFVQTNWAIRMPWSLAIDILSLAALIFGLWRLFLPPTWGSANLLLALTFLPLTLSGWSTINVLISWMESRQSGIIDFPMSTGTALTTFENLIERTVLAAAPSLVIYLFLVTRIAINKNPSPTDQKNSLDSAS